MHGFVSERFCLSFYLATVSQQAMTYSSKLILEFLIIKIDI